MTTKKNETRKLVADFDGEVTIEEILAAKEADNLTWTPELCAGVIEYRLIPQDGRIFLVRISRPRGIAPQKQLFRYREKRLEQYDRERKWSRDGVVAYSEYEALRCFGIPLQSHAYYETVSRPYAGTKKPGTRIRIER